MNIAITGEGIICAIGTDKSSVLDSLRHQRTGIGEMHYLQSSHRELPVGEVHLSNEEMARQLGLTPDDLQSRTALMGMLAVRQALRDAGITCSGIKDASLRVILVSGTTVAGMDVAERYFSEIQHSDEHLMCMKIHDAGYNTKQIADFFGCFSEYTTISTACSSAANALILGASLLKAGQADMVVAGGTEALSLFHLNGFRSLMILDKAHCRPFDSTRAGLNLGEGAAYVVLEPEERARSRRADVHAWLSGYGNACDAFHQTATSDNGEGACLAMKEAIAMAGLLPGDIQYVNAHGTGTPNNDLTESVALRRVFGEKMPLVSSTKAFTGHTTSASGSIEAVISILALQHQFVPANLGWQHPMADGIIPSLGEEHASLTHVLCNSFGFGGNDSSLVISMRLGMRNEELGMRNDDYLAGLESADELEMRNEKLGMRNDDYLASPESAYDSAYRSNHHSSFLISHSSFNNHSSFLISHFSFLSSVKVELTSESDLSEIRDYVKPMEARRMGRLLKASLLSSLKALQLAGIERPDAIITGTALGCWENSEALLRQLEDEGEVLLSPTLFMQSTHNTISSQIAIRTHCHGYNVTYSQGRESLSWALRDAEMLLRSGRCKTVLVGCHDATTPLYRSLMSRLGVTGLPELHSVAIVLSCGE